ncbi:unannotated protein [freshwater metagenome]|uniref:tyrosine--tRNA ligase n=1 Tax=freshwater metagenome TaxID=449393 RepID=A0A6J7H8S8_9ZZZZ|nr:tyrosine--tRNA ligase [Actinomycetota bacterium]
MSDLLSDLHTRGLVAQSTDLGALHEEMAKGPLTLYCGFDPTAPSLHLGNLAQIVLIRRFQDVGHRPLALVGGATGLIGDPKMTGERTLNPADVVGGWVDRIRAQLEKFYDFSGANAAIVVNNLDWTEGVSALEFLRDIGKHFSVNRMLDREAVAARLAGGGISYTEFSYQILQSFDYLELFRRYGCTLQTGGSDQWGNITAGVDLVRRVEAASVHALTSPLITKADGTKFGKTESGTVWLDPALTSPYAFWQFWINSDDRDAATLLRTFSLRSIAEVEELLALQAERPHARDVQQALARELTTLVHGAAECQAAEEAAKALFGQADLATLPPATLDAAMRETPFVEIAPDEIVGGQLPSYADLLARTGLVAGKGAARRTIAEGGAYLNNERVTAEDYAPTTADLLHGRWLVLRRGKRSMAGILVGGTPL